LHKKYFCKETAYCEEKQVIYAVVGVSPTIRLFAGKQQGQ